MKTIKSIAAWQKLRRGPLFAAKSVGFVPTMGALHEGHLALVRRSARENGLTVASIFVNPAQFNDPRDLRRYPRTLAADVEKLAGAGAGFLLLPSAQEMYADGYAYRVSENSDSKVLCGAHRPGHFEGVLTVVLKLLNLVRADRAYFGEKDFQQLQLIKGMAKAFFLGTDIVPCQTEREADGLAMSSRNLLLSARERRLAPALHKVLREAPTPKAAKQRLESLGFAPDYVEERWGRRFAAAHLGKVRLIDNVPA